MLLDAPEATAPRMLIVHVELAGHPLTARLSAGEATVVLTRDELRPQTPFVGRLFELIDGAAGTVRLLVPLLWLGGEPVPELVSVVDHVNLELRGPLTGRWPAARPRSFPRMTGLYRSPGSAAGGEFAERQPRRDRGAVEPHVYSEVTVAGVADVDRPTPFERRQLHANSFDAACDCLVAAAIIAAHHGLGVVAFGAPRRADRRREKGTP